MASKKLRAKEYAQLARTIDSFSGGQAYLMNNDSDDLQTITVAIKPHGGPYKGGAFMFDVSYHPQTHMHI